MEESLVYAEVYEILNLIDERYSNKIPQKFKEFLDVYRNKQHKVEIDTKKLLIHQNLQRGTLVVLTILTLKYWCENQEEKNKIMTLLSEHDKIQKRKLKEKYNIDDLFKHKVNVSEKNQVQMIEYKKRNFIQKIVNKLVEFLKAITRG